MSIIKVFDQYLCKGLENVPVLREGNVSKEEYSAFQVKCFIVASRS